MMMTISPVIHAAAQLLALRVIQSLAVGTLIAFFAAAVLRFFWHNSSTKFAVWFSALLAIAAVPIISGAWLWQVPAVSQTSPAVTLPDSWALYLFATWTVISSWLLLGLARSLWHLRSIRKGCVTLHPGTLHPMIRETLQRHQTKRHISLCTSARVRIPTAIGLANSAVVIPEWLMGELSPEELNQILLHEVAHLRRWDDWTNLAQQFIKAIFFFHPAVWWIEKKVALEREMACDDAVLAETNSPRTYAECLVRLAEKSFVVRGVALAQAALGRIRQTTLRVSRILDPLRPPSHDRALKPAVSLVAVFALGCGVWTARTSKLIAFENSGSVQSTGATAVSHSSSATDSPAVRAIPAVARLSQTLRVTPAKLKTSSNPVHRSPAQSHPVPPSSAHRREQLLRLTSTTTTEIPITETVFVVIRDCCADSAGAPEFQIQMWRVTVLRTFVHPTDIQTSSKEI